MFKVSPPPAGGSQKSHNIKCAKLLTSTVEYMDNQEKPGMIARAPPLVHTLGFVPLF